MGAEEYLRVGELLIEEGVLTQEDVERLVAQAGLKGTALAALLEQAHHVRRADLALFLASDFVVPKIEDLRKFDLYEEAARAVPEPLARRHGIVPLAKMGNVLCIARPSFDDKGGIAELRASTGLRVKMFQAEEEQIRAALDRIYGRGTVEIPPPRAASQTSRAIPPAPEEVSEGIPLIAIPDDPDKTPVLKSRVEEVVLEPAPAPVLEAIRVSPEEGAGRSSEGNFALEFEETFLGLRPFTPIRMA